MVLPSKVGAIKCTITGVLIPEGSRLTLRALVSTNTNAVSADTNANIRNAENVIITYAVSEQMAGPKGFDPLTCGSEDRRDVLTTLRAPAAIADAAISRVIEIVINPARQQWP